MCCNKWCCAHQGVLRMEKALGLNSVGEPVGKCDRGKVGGSVRSNQLGVS